VTKHKPQPCRVGALHPRAFLVAFIMLLAASSPALAQSIDVTATLDITNGLARPGAYVPVRLKVTNGTAEAISEVRISSGSPVEVTAPWDLVPGLTDGRQLPVLYQGGDLALTIEFVVAGAGRTIRAKVTVPNVRALEADTGIVAVAPSLPEPDEPFLRQLREALGAKSLHILRLDVADRGLVGQCGILDAIVIDGPSPEKGGRSVVVNAAAPEPKAAASLFPAGVLETVQPEAYRLFGAKVWPAEDRRRLWLWLGLVSLAVLPVSLLLPRRRAFVLAGSLVALAMAATGLIWLFGDVSMTKVQEARVYYASQDPSLAALEHLVQLASRGGKTASYSCALPFVQIGSGSVERGVSVVPDATLPLPILASADDLFRTQCRLQCGQVFENRTLPVSPLTKVAPLDTVKKVVEEVNLRRESDSVRRVFRSEMQTRQPLMLFHTFMKEEPPFHYALTEFAAPELAKLAQRSDLVKALLVEGDRATDAGGKTQPVDAWAVEWQGSKDPDVAYAGRSLAWWKKDRQEGDGPWILAWWHDPLPADQQGKGHERLPALVVYSAATKQQ